MRAGNKNRRVRIEVLSINKSTFGTDTETWSLLREVWAEQTFITTKEIEEHAADQILSESFVAWKIDYIASIAPKANRIIYNGQIYDIWHVTEVGFHEALVLKCRQTAIGGVGTGVGITGSAVQSAPPTQPQLTRQGTYNVNIQQDETVTVVAYQEYETTIVGINNIGTSIGSTTLTVNINGIPVTGLTNISVTTVAQNVLATASNVVHVGDKVDFVFSNSNNARDLKFTMKSKIN